MPINSDTLIRLETAIQYLVSVDMINGKNPKTSIANKTGYNSGNISSALKGNPRYLTEKFIKVFCAKYNNVISSDWVLNGTGEMVQSKPEIQDENMPISDENLMYLTKDNLISLVKRLMDIHKEQTEMYKSIIRQSEEIIRNGQEQFNEIANLITNNV